MTCDFMENCASSLLRPSLATSVSELSFENVAREDHSSELLSSPIAEPRNIIDNQTFFFADVLVTIYVEHTRFRIPREFLTRDSQFFRDILSASGTDAVSFKDADVTSSAFESLLHLLFPPSYGICPIMSLSQWTGVLHLADKWGFSGIRDAAATAISPLASSVDKIVLGRRYKLDNWVSQGLVNLLEREDDLSLEDAKALELEDVVMIAKGRLRARRVSGVCSTPVIKVLVAGLLQNGQLGSSSPCVIGSPKKELDPRTIIGKREETVDEICARGIINVCLRMCYHGALMPKPSSILNNFIAKGPAHASAAIHAVLNHLWLQHDMHWQSNIVHTMEPAYTGSEHLLLHHLKSQMNSIEFGNMVKEYCLRKIHNWDALLHSSVISPTDLTLSKWNLDQDLHQLPRPVLDMIAAARFTRYIIDTGFVDEATLSKTVFAGFWTTMSNAFAALWSEAVPCCDKRLMNIIRLVGKSVFIQTPSADAFYYLVRHASPRGYNGMAYTKRAAIRDRLQAGILTTASWPRD